MGREAELLEAARAGHYHLAEKILAHRAKLSGPLASLRRGPGANVQDSSGYTPLHHAALNGHKDIVQLLLSYDASPNILDTKGSSPLHLAAWAGHTGIVKLLLTHGPALTNVNLTTRDNESALHCAAQYGHTAVVSMLLQHGADPNVRSVRDETALDLASQYGRLETVELLVRTHPELLEPYRYSRGMFNHTPLHRASKNGHKAVVVVLLKAGHNVNACTASGTALHEAALCGKLNVAHALLTRGADPRVRDRAGDTVLDALARFPAHVTHEIVTLINKFRLQNGFESDQEDLPRIPVQQHDGLNSPYDNVHPSNHANNRHVWERREEDERRVSGTSAISMNPQLSLIPGSPKQFTKPRPSSYMLLLASKCFGIKSKHKSIADYGTSTPFYGRKITDSNESDNAAGTTAGLSKFFGKSRQKQDAFEKDGKRIVKHRKRRVSKITHSLPDIFEDSESTSLSSNSFKSIVSISNSIYIASELNKNSKSPEESEVAEVVKTSQSEQCLVSAVNRLALEQSTSNNQNIEKNPALRLSQSIRTLRNWTSGNAYKNTEPVYVEENFTSTVVNSNNTTPNNLSYAHLDFSLEMSKKCQVAIDDSDYEPYDFKANVETREDNVFKPIEVCNAGNLMKEDNVNDRKDIFTEENEIKPTPAPRKINIGFDDTDSVTSSTTRSCSFKVEDMGSECDSWALESLPSDMETYEELSKIYSNMTNTSGASVRSGFESANYNSINSYVTESDRSRISERVYLPMDGILLFSKDYIQSQPMISRAAAVSTLRQVRDEDDPVYQNVVLAQDITSGEIKSPMCEPLPTSNLYHSRGSGDCIYESPFKNDYIYVLNRDSRCNFDVYPFLRVPRNTVLSADFDSRNICFCGGREENVYANVDSEMFTCSDAECKLHNAKCKMLKVKYSPLTQSVSFPDMYCISDAHKIRHDSLPSAFVPCNKRESSASSLSFHSLSDDYSYVEMKPRNVSPVCCPLLEGGRSLCVRSGSDGGHYPYSKSSAMEGSYHSEELSSSYQSGKNREPDQLSISSTTSSTGGPSPRERQRCGTNESSVSGQGIYMSGYHAHSPGSNTKVSPTPPKKPPRRNLSVSPTHLLPPGIVADSIASAERSHHLVRTGQTRSQDDLDDLGPGSKHSGLRHGRSVDQYVENKSPRTKPVPQPRPSLAHLQSRRDQPVAISAMYENVVIKEQNPRRKLRRNHQYENSGPKENQKYSSQERSSLESLLDDVSSYHTGTPSDGENVGYRNDRSAQLTPLSPTHYNQPPTPDHPPPSAKQAEMSIHERIRPLSQEYKRMSRDMETEIDPRLLARSSSPASSASTDHCVEEYVAEVPFAGLFKGSTTTLDGIGVRPVPAERPKSLRKLKTVYDNGAQGLGSGVVARKDIQPGTRIDPDVDPWQYRQNEEKEQIISNPPSVTSIDKPLSLLSPFDEQEEWNKINEIMASFGSKLVRESVFAEELEQEFKSRLGARFSCSETSLSPCLPAGPSILSWLASLGLQHLESNFVNNGYDHLDFINGVIEDNDLAEMAIEEPEKTKVLESCKSLPLKIDEIVSVTTGNNHNNNINNHSNNNNSDKESEEDPEAVNKWLTSIGLECYQDTFRRHLYTDMERVRRIWEVELTAVLEIQKVGHRRRILASVAGRQNGPINNIEDIKADLNTLERNIQTLKAEIKEKLPDTPKATNYVNHSQNEGKNQTVPVPPTTNLTTPAPGGETLKRSHKKNRPPPPPPLTRPDLEIRAPSALLVGVPETLRTQWRHAPLVLVTGSVMYVANYLGSTIIKELRGKESTQKSIQKLKKSTNEPRALPDIILSISYRGVKFLNTITRDLVCEHEIRNIHLACQDADDLTHFAYITKDVSKTHYCHVFCVATMDQATEVILTLGQAFEVAYQMALRDSAMKSANNTLQPSQVRSQSSNQISQQAKTPTHEKPVPNNAKDRPNQVHGRSHSVTEIKLNGHQLKVAPISVSISNEDFQASRNGDVQKSPRTPSGKAPIALAEEL